MKLTLFLLAGILLAYDCNVDDSHKIDCGHVGTNQQQCEASNCCWKPVAKGDVGDNIPWCYYPASYNPCGTLLWNAEDPGFDDNFISTMNANYLKNLNIQGSGAVVAAPDHNTPGGSYYYHWMRDGALSMKVFMELNDLDYDKVKDYMTNYENWVRNVQRKTDPNGIDVRIEPKFTIPDGSPYTGGWCRPQTDGPGLRANSMAMWGNILVNASKIDHAKNDVWPLVKNDLDWVLSNWQSNGCDLWEEVRSNDFFWGRMAYIYSLKAAATFATSIGQNDEAAQYKNLADTIKEATKSHWNGQYIFESSNRPKDGATIHAIAAFGKGADLYPPSSAEAAATIAVLNTAFCAEFPINEVDTKAGIPGILYGRYPGDSYAGGNPWQLLSAVLAENFYLTAADFQKKGNLLLGEEHREWMNLLGMRNGTANQLADAAIAAGNSILTRIYSHVKNDGGRIDEQMDKNNGAQASAKGLTWSYANILHALKANPSMGLDKNLGPNVRTY